MAGFRELTSAITEGVNAQKILCIYFGDVGGLYPQILSLPFDVIGLDFVAGYRNWEVVKQAPFSKGLMFGILDARNTRMETVDEVVTAIRRITDVVPPERLMVSPSAGLEFLPHGVARRKLQVLVEGTRAAAQALKGARA
jgi:5-methyltetrahydropteroyltriglutamate--homocysteine methyltransferase